jgi:hypothetical protein
MTERHFPAGLGHTAQLTHSARFPLLGVQVEIRSNSAEVIAIAEETFGPWRGLAPELIAPVPPVTVRVVVQRVEQALQAAGPRPFVHRAHGGCFVASDGVNLLTAQYREGHALAFVAPELVQREAQLRYNVLQLLALLLVTQHDRVPVHAGAVVRDGLAILLAGPSTAGKSTLCYACLRDGFQLLAEDVVYVSHSPSLRLWGVPDDLHLLPDAVRFFPELADVQPAVQANGKFKLAVKTARFGADRTTRHSERAVVCLVERHDDAATLLEPIAREQAVAALSQDREPGFDLYDGAERAAGALVARGAYRLTVGHDLSRAAQALRQLALTEAGTNPSR